MARPRREPDKIILEAALALPEIKRRAVDCETVYGNQAGHIDLGYNAVVEKAAEILRKRAGWTRAEAVEMAYDNLLLASNGTQWRRTGEVTLLMPERVVRAFCAKRTEGG